MSKVAVFSKVACKEGKDAELEEAMKAMVAAGESIDGVELYSYHRAEDGSYWFFALMSSMEATMSHAQDPALQAVMPAAMEAMDGPPEVALTTPVAAAGFDI
ncbi:MAG: hypothetical protein OXE79_08220 [Acidimicrobiaceae bacterium]|nr:hypothetical protein [Acidimicrobiaceae bacterium]MCY4175716.1 hypothetical protein [Acidimicrobiaceae bacterium]MCY4279628.1 hypothetical protein [Acidimicrobiaceae bacterium]MCY4295126.1 hypothetical protein [Acidimicrobiaceae bacterium]